MKRIFMCFIFSIILLFILLNIEKIIKNKFFFYNTSMFYTLQKDVDVIFLGTSRVQYTLSPMEIWDKYGILSYNRASASQYYKLTYFLEKEIYNHYKPKLLVIDILYLLTLTNYNVANRTNIVLNNLQNKIDTYNAFKEVNSINTIEAINNMNIYNLFHQRWKELTIYDFTSEDFWYGKFNGSYTIYPEWYKMHQIENREYNKSYVDVNTPLNTESIKYINLINEIAKSHNSNVLFINMPFGYFDNNLYNLINSFEKYAKENNIAFLDYNKLADTIKIDYTSDFRDYAHLNLYGARKVMDHLIPYIIKHYNIPNRKNGPAYASWNDDYIKYARAINREEIRELKSFQEWQKQAFYDNYTVLISVNGGVLRNLPETLKNYLKSFGLKKYDTDRANMHYAAIIDDNKVFFEEISNKPVTYKGRMKNIVNLLVSSDGRATINVSGKPRAKNKYGINFVIYDKVNREIVDSIWIDPNKPDEVRR